MGRRKIEIKAIKDDRNRSVTFLKRKGGLFKKAHELSVLCSVDVAVIIFGHNKKLYEFSSGDINETIGRYQYYGQPHEHKGPADYRGKSAGDSDEDDEDASPPRDEMPPQAHPQFPPHLQSQNIYHAPSASPPMPQHGIPFQARHGTPQPPNGSRPSSRNDVRRMSSNLNPMQHPQPHPHATPPPPQQNGFAYMPNAQMYHQQPNPNMPRPPPAQATPPPQFQQQFAQHQAPQHYQHPQQSHPPPQPPQQHPAQQVHQAYLQEQRRQSIPPTSEPSERQHSLPPPQHPPQHLSPEPEQRPPQIKMDHDHHDDSPERPKHISSKSRSIFTPIDERGSVLAQHFGFSEPREARPERAGTSDHVIRSNGPTSAAIKQLNHAQRTHSMPMPGIPPPSRTNTNSSKTGGARPRLKVQIPSEASDAESATEESSPRQSDATTATPARGSSGSHHSGGVVLPPPSPSASALLSAGATGPPNPFARPPPRDSNLPTHNAYTNNVETPISALPSRFVADNLLPSPSSFYPEWGFGRTGPDSNMLPSPLTFPTPVKESGPSFASGGKDLGVGGPEKRKGSEERVDNMKKVKA